MSGLSIHRDNRLKHKKDIDFLFTQGSSTAKYPVLLVYRKIPISITENKQSPSFQVGFTVSKKKFKRAVDRNRVKRLMREAFRCHQSELSIDDSLIQIMFVYTAKEILDLKQIDKSIIKLLQKVQ